MQMPCASFNSIHSNCCCCCCWWTRCSRYGTKVSNRASPCCTHQRMDLIFTCHTCCYGAAAAAAIAPALLCSPHHHHTHSIYIDICAYIRSCILRIMRSCCHLPHTQKNRIRKEAGNKNNLTLAARFGRQLNICILNKRQRNEDARFE